MPNFVSKSVPLSCIVFLIGTAIAGSAWLGKSAWAQTEQATAAPPRMLYIDVVEGEAELNDIRARTAREPVVQVRDENHKPVSGALVLFSIQSGGAQPIASFSGLPTVSARTGPDGIARARGYQTTRVGNVQIAVQATVGTVTTQAIIHQTNYSHANGFKQTLSAHKELISVVSAGAAFAAVASITIAQSQTPYATTITVGPGTVSASRQGSNRR